MIRTIARPARQPNAFEDEITAAMPTHAAVKLGDYPSDSIWHWSTPAGPWVISYTAGGTGFLAALITPGHWRLTFPGGTFQVGERLPNRAAILLAVAATLGGI